MRPEIVILVATALSAQVDFDAARSFLAFSARAVATADFDEDGALDVALCYSSHTPSGQVSVLFGDGAGELRPPAHFSTGSGGLSTLLAADLDGDGHADVAVAHLVGETAAVILGDGAGGFSSPATYSLVYGRDPAHMAAGDFNEDSILDLAVACERTDTVSILLGTGGGAFADGLPFSANDGPTQVALADFDSDGHLDFATPSSGPSATHLIHFRFGDGTGLFPRRGSRPAGGQTHGLVAADFDDDGNADLAASLEALGEIRIFYGDGLGGFPLAESFFAPPSNRLLVADVDRDRRPDVVAVAHDEIVVLLDDPATGSFASPRAFHGADEATDVAAGDFDGDRRLDLVTVASSHTVALHFGDGCGGFPSRGRIPLAPHGESVELADFDGDGRLDVAMTDSRDDLIVASPGDGSGGFTLPGVTLSSSLSAPRGIAVADFDGNSAPDVLLTAGGAIAVFRGDGSGGFGAPTLSGVAGSPRAVAVADMNSDGSLDAVAACFNGDTVAVLLGSGGGDLGAPTHFPAGEEPFGLAIADFDEDGDPDAAVTLQADNAVALFSGDGLGGLAAPFFLPAGGRPGRTLAGDFDADSHADLAVTGSSTFGPLFVFSGDGTGAFSVPFKLELGYASLGIARADFDGDAVEEFAVAHPHRPSDVAIVAADGAGGFAVTRRFAVASAQDVAAGDLDLDGRPDLVAVPFEGGLVALRNLTSAATSAVLGNVNAALGPIENVLFVNGARGIGPERRVTVDPFVLFQIRMKLPSSDLDGSARFALNAWVGDSRNWTVTRTPFGPIGLPPVCAKKTWNNTGETRFGAPDLPSSPAPSVVVRREGGIRMRGLFFVQGFVEDAASPSGDYAVTNGILIDSR